MSMILDTRCVERKQVQEVYWQPSVRFCIIGTILCVLVIILCILGMWDAGKDYEGKYNTMKKHEAIINAIDR